MTEQGFGFGASDRKSEPTIWDDYIGESVHASNNVQAVYGVLREINLRKGYVDFMPSVVANPDSSEIFLATERPTRMMLPLLAIRPLPEKSIERFVENYRKTAELKKLKEQAELEGLRKIKMPETEDYQI